MTKLLITQNVNYILTNNKNEIDLTEAELFYEDATITQLGVWDVKIFKINNKFYLSYQLLHNPIEFITEERHYQFFEISKELMIKIKQDRYEKAICDDINHYLDNLNLEINLPMQIMISNTIYFTHNVNTVSKKVFFNDLISFLNHAKYFYSLIKINASFEENLLTLTTKLQNEYDIIKKFYEWYNDPNYLIAPIEKVELINTYTIDGIKQDFKIRSHNLTEFKKSDEMFIYNKNTKQYLVRTIKQIANNDLSNWQNLEIFVYNNLKYFAIKIKGKLYYLYQCNIQVSLPIIREFKDYNIVYLDEFNNNLFREKYLNFTKVFRKYKDYSFIELSVLKFIEYYNKNIEPITDKIVKYIINNTEQWLNNYHIQKIKYGVIMQ